MQPLERHEYFTTACVIFKKLLNYRIELLRDKGMSAPPAQKKQSQSMSPIECTSLCIERGYGAVHHIQSWRQSQIHTPADPVRNLDNSPANVSDVGKFKTSAYS